SGQRSAAHCARRVEFRRAADGQRPDAARHPLLRCGRAGGGGASTRRRQPRGFRCEHARLGHGDSRCARLGRRAAPCPRGTRQPVARRAYRARSQSALRRAGDHGNAHFRPAVGLAELGVLAAQCRRRGGRLEALRHRRAAALQLGACLGIGSAMAIDYQERIPNNVDLAGNATLQRALEHWQPRFLDWWREMGPSDFLASEVYLRTATSVDAKGWATYGPVKMPDYRWGIFLADPVADRRIGFGDELGKPAWSQVPGEHRSTLRRLIVTQGDTEP